MHGFYRSINDALGDAASAKAQFDKAVAACASGEACVQLARRLKDDGMSAADLGELMDSCGAKLASANDKLRWAEGVADLLLDSDWAAKAYAGIAGSFTDEVGKSVWPAASRCAWLSFLRPRRAGSLSKF